MNDQAPKRSHHPLRENLEVLVLAVVMALGLKVFAVEPYQIPTGSMMPTLLGTPLHDPVAGTPNGAIHDRVLVDKLSYLLRDPERWEVVVFRYPLVTHTNYVKRLVGMPGEWIQIQHGDVYARKGEEGDFTILRKPRNVQESLWKKVFPLPQDHKKPWTLWRTENDRRIQPEDRRVSLEAGTTIRYVRSIRDEYRHGYPESIYGRIPEQGIGILVRSQVSDLKLDFQTRTTQAGSLRAALDCGPYPLNLELPGTAAGEARLRLPDGRIQTQDVPAASEREWRVSLAFWDHRVHLLARSGETEWELGPLDLELVPEPPIQNSVRFSALEGSWQMELPTIWRDIHYQPPMHNRQAMFEVPERQYFVLGDNTQNSLDSRDWKARHYTLNQAIEGREELIGNDQREGLDPFLDNPRFNYSFDLVTFRDQYGELYTFPRYLIEHDSNSEYVHFVPREYMIGKVLAVFLPIPPFSPITRIHAVR